MHNIIRELRTRLRYKIIMPFLVLTMFVALVTAVMMFTILAGSAQQRLTSQSIEASRLVNYAIANQERANLQFLVEVVFAPANNATGVPSVAEGVARNDRPGLIQALTPYFRQGMNRPTVQVDRLIAFNTEGIALVDMKRTNPNTKTFIVQDDFYNLADQWFVDAINTETKDETGDKYAGQITLVDSDGNSDHYFATIVPVKFNDKVVGGLIVAMQTERLLNELSEYSKADVIVFYDAFGHAEYSNLSPQNGIRALDIDQDLAYKVRSDVSGEQRDGKNEEGSISDIRIIDTIDYQFMYTYMRIRNSPVGIIATGISRASMMQSWSETRMPLILTSLFLICGIILVGLLIARQITAPVEELVASARSVIDGNFDRRSVVRSHDEIGILSDSFNKMTGHLVTLIDQVVARYGERSAIVESIGDGIVVCDMQGAVQLINKTARAMLGLDEQAIAPGWFRDIPLIPLTEKVFGAEPKDIFSLGSYIVRVSVSPVHTIDGGSLGNVYVLQDLTQEVNMDRAKTGFIATISHELRTPLTSMRGNLDMLIHGLAGPLNDQQKPMLETIGTQTTGMTRLVNNMIMVAGLDSGSIKVELESVQLKQVIEKAVWPSRKKLKAKKLALKAEIPPDLPPVQADPIQLRTVFQQLIENAYVYTDEGGITFRATHEGKMVRIDVIDTGCGIDSDMVERVFERFVRGKGDQSNDRPDRGIGLGLAIVKDIVERHGGRVWVESTPGKGSTFSFTLLCCPIPEDDKADSDKDVSEAA